LRRDPTHEKAADHEKQNRDLRSGNGRRHFSWPLAEDFDVTVVAPTDYFEVPMGRG
jgi:hypothetical protein